MLIVDLVVAVCMVSNPTACRDEHLYFESHGSLRQCMAEAIPALAKWAGDHPRWNVVRFHCRFADGKEEEI